MDYQPLFNMVLGVGSVMGTWIFKLMWSTLDNLKVENAALKTKVNSIELDMARNYTRKDEVDSAFSRIMEKVSRIETIELMLANHYVRKDDFTKALDGLSIKLDRIVEKLDSKADK
jgi:hypothetical protein